METKIPPPIVTLVFGLLIYFSQGIFPSITNQLTFYVGISFMLLGFSILISAVGSFKRSKTTVNPLNPEQATKLVTDKIFTYSSNPMYRGMATILSSLALVFTLVGGILCIALCFFYITTYQIILAYKYVNTLF